MLKLSILAVDDSLVITEMIKDAFEAEGYKVITAADGAEALKMALDQNPDIIIADITMPGMDGWELCSQIRSNPFTSFIPFIFLTAQTEAPDRIRGLQMGADDYLTKPFEMEELLVRVQLIFERMRKSQEAVLTQKKKTLSGSTSEMALPDLLQMFSINQKTGLLRINKMGFPDGNISLENGEIIRVSIGNIKGEKALYRMLRWNEAHFDVQPLMNNDKLPGFPMTANEALMEGMRQIDELTALENDLQLNGKSLAVKDKPSESELSPREIELLSTIEKSEEFGQVLDSLPWTDFEICRMIAYFHKKGVVDIV
jgi:CheY-like chemotaxis protein